MALPHRRIEDDGIKRAALYIRVSTEEQAMHGLSLPAQRETLTRYAAENGLLVAGIYADEGITARKKYRNRAGFMRMLRDVEAGKIDLILFIKLDRWFRNVADYYEVQKLLDAHDVQWIATEEDYDTTTANGRLHLNIKLSIAQDESDRTSERIKFVFDSKVRRGEVISGSIPMGYCIENKRLVVDEEKAAVVRDIFAQYIALRSLKALRKAVIAKYGIVHTERAYKLLLQNEKYIGAAYGLDDYCPAIIDRETFSRVQSILAQRGQRTVLATGHSYLFTGLVSCAECGWRLSARTVGEKYVYYRCTRSENWHDCPHNRQTNEATLENWLLSNLISSFERYNSEIEALAARPQKHVDEAKIRRKLDKLKDLYLNDLIDRDTYERDYLSLRAELDASKQATAEIPKHVDIKAVEDALCVYPDLTRQGKKEFWSRTIRKIIVTQDNDFSITPYIP